MLKSNCSKLWTLAKNLWIKVHVAIRIAWKRMIAFAINDHPLFSRYEDVYRFYIKNTEWMVKAHEGSIILKTDAHNESGLYRHSMPIVPLLSQYAKKVTCIEFDKEVLMHAEPLLDRYPNVDYRIGDIRESLGMTYDLIFDFSTIDHVPFADAMRVIHNYRAHLAPTGILCIYVWTSEARENVSSDWHPGNQYYFYRRDFIKLLQACGFTVAREIYILNWDTRYHVSDRKLYQYIALPIQASEEKTAWPESY